MKAEDGEMHEKKVKIRKHTGEIKKETGGGRKRRMERSARRHDVGKCMKRMEIKKKTGEGRKYAGGRRDETRQRGSPGVESCKILEEERTGG